MVNLSPLSRRRFLQQSALVASTALGAGSLLQACGSSDTTTQSSGPITLTVMIGALELPKNYIIEFQKQNPGITIKQLEADPVRLSAMIAAGQPPDVFRIIGATDVPGFAARGLLADLSSYFDKSTVLNPSKLAPINDVYRWNGTTQGQGARYGLAKDWSLDYQLWYNKKLFDQAKVPYPSETQPLSYDELLNLAKKVTVKQGDKIQTYGLDIGWTMGNTYGVFLQALQQEGASLFSKDYTQADFTTPEAKKFLKWIVDWAQAGVGPSPVEANPSNGWVLYPAGRVAMWFCGYYMGGAMSASAPDVLANSVLAPAPLWGTTPVSGCGSATGACVASTSQHKDAAWKFMEYYFAGHPAADRAKTGWGIPSLTTYYADMPQQTPVQQQLYQSVQADMKNLRVLPFAPYISSDAMSNALSKYIGPVMKGQTSLDQGAQQLTDTVNLLLAQGKSLSS